MRFIKLDNNQEIDWSRVALAVIGILIGAVLIFMAISWAALALFPVQAPGPAAADGQPIPTMNISKNRDNLTPAWPEEVLKLRPVSVAADPVPAALVPKLMETSPGVRNLGEFFTIRRDNVSGNKDLEIKTTVYGFKELYQVKWYSDSWGDYFYQFAPDGEKYVFVYLVSWVEGDTPEKDSRPWFFGPHLFKLQINNRLYDQDADFVPEVRILELEDVTGYNGIKGLRPYGYVITQTPKLGNITAELDPYMKMGQSNAKDGYLVFRVPESYQAEDMILVGSFGSWGPAGWRLVK